VSTSARRARAALLGVVVLVVVAGCSSNDNGQNALKPKGKYAEKADNIWELAFWIAAVIGVLVFLALIVVMIRFRYRPGNENPKQHHGNTAMEIGWTIAPAILLAILAVPSVKTIFELADDPAADAVHVRVVGHQYWWEYQYLDSEPSDDHVPEVLFATANELVIPTQRDVALYVTSIDVIHSFWIPSLAGKQDAVPGREVRMLMAADEPGTFLGQCAELCGLSHANMRAVAIAYDAAGFETWMAEQQAPPAAVTGLAAEGQALVTSLGCVGCHATEGFAGEIFGPDLTHVASRDRYAGAIFDFAWGTPAGAEQLKAWIANAPHEKPGATMRDYAGQLTPEQLDALVAYLETRT
jgi:cytochrome c oxidase subunit II